MKMRKLFLKKYSVLKRAMKIQARNLSVFELVAFS